MPLTITRNNCASIGVTGSVADLLRRARDGERAAWEELRHRYGQLISATVRSFRLQDADALDAIQATWLRLIENAHQVHSPERLAGWLATTARRECLGILRRTKRAPELVDPAADTVADPSAGPEQRVIDADTARTLWKLVEELSPRQRTLLRLLFTDDPRPYTEVARAAGIPHGGIGPTRARALQQLRRKLDEHRLGPGVS
jgi:RNA polymerase sigma factor (sigma-70 family)